MLDEIKFKSHEEALQFVVAHFEEELAELRAQQQAQSLLISFLLPIIEANHPDCRKRLESMINNWHKEDLLATTDPYDHSTIEKIAESMRAMLYPPKSKRPALQVIMGGKPANGEGK